MTKTYFDDDSYLLTVFDMPFLVSWSLLFRGDRGGHWEWKANQTSSLLILAVSPDYGRSIGVGPIPLMRVGQGRGGG